MCGTRTRGGDGDGSQFFLLVCVSERVIFRRHILRRHRPRPYRRLRARACTYIGIEMPESPWSGEQERLWKNCRISKRK